MKTIKVNSPKNIPKNYTGIVEHKNGTKFWKLNGKLHREGGPAVEHPNESGYWLNGKLHREDGPAIVKSNGDEGWYQHGELHRKDGPAVTYSDVGIQEYWIHGQRHREDGPAVELHGKVFEYWWNGIKLNKEQFSNLKTLIDLGYPEKVAIKLNIMK